jgi:SAM-dependent methyltransferase
LNHPRLDVNRSTYDEIGVGYAELNRELPQSVIDSMDRFTAALPAGSVVADVGCGPGRDLAELRRRGLRVIGLDLSIGMLRAGGHPGVAQADMTTLPIASAALDGLWCAAAFLHIPRELSGVTLDGFARILRPGGRLHLSVQEGDGDEVRQARLGRGQDLYYVLHQEEDLTALLSASGFVVDTVHRSEAERRWLTLGAERLGG